MRDDHAVCMAGSGHTNIAGLTPQAVFRFAQAYRAVPPI